MYSKVLKAMVVATLAAAPFATQADVAPGEQKGDWLFRVNIAQVNPDSDNLKLEKFEPVIPGSMLVVDRDLSATFDITYMFSNHFGVELLAAYPFTHGIDVKPYSGSAPARRPQPRHDRRATRRRRRGEGCGRE